MTLFKDTHREHYLSTLPLTRLERYTPIHNILNESSGHDFYLVEVQSPLTWKLAVASATPEDAIDYAIQAGYFPDYLSIYKDTEGVPRKFKIVKKEG